MEKVLVDADLILDLLARREPFHASAAELFSLAERRRLSICVSPATVSDLFEILGKLENRGTAIECLQKLTRLVRILPVERKAVELALASDFENFDDAVRYYTAIRSGIRFWITRNAARCKEGGVTILTAEEFLKIREITKTLRSAFTKGGRGAPREASGRRKRRGRRRR
jgi:predicted nucleic acid-binding protein